MSDTTSNGLMARIEGPSPAMEVAVDLLRRALIWAPIALLGSAAIWGTDGAISAAAALALVVVNFLLSAWMLQVGGRISLAVMAGAALFGYLLRLGLILVVVLLIKDQSWLDPVAFGMVLIVSHLGLLFWELRYVSGSMAYPGVKPRPGKTPAEVTVHAFDPAADSISRTGTPADAATPPTATPATGTPPTSTPADPEQSVTATS